MVLAHAAEVAGDLGRVGQHHGAMADRDAVGRHQGEPVLGLEHQRLDPRPGQRLGAGQDLAAVLGPAHAGGHHGDAGHLGQVAGPDRADGRHDRVDAGVEHRSQRVGDGRAGTRAAAGDAVEADGHRGPNQSAVQGRPDPGGMRHDQHLLHAAQFLVGQPHVLHVTHAGVQPVDRSAAGQGGVHDGPAGEDQGPCLGAQLDRRATGDLDQLLDGERRLGDGDGGHATSGAGHSTPPSGPRRTADGPQKYLAKGARRPAPSPLRLPTGWLLGGAAGGPPAVPRHLPVRQPAAGSGPPGPAADLAAS
jgi:hypothetical protein